MRTRTLIGAGVALALAAGVGAYSVSSFAQGGPGYGPGWMMGGGYGPGMMGGYGPGYHRGWRGGRGEGPWNCPAFGQDDGSGRGYGPGYHMRGWGGGYGPGMMRGWGYGRGYGPGYDRRGEAQSDQSTQNNQGPQTNQSAQSNQDNRTLNLSTDDVKNRMERWLAWRDNPRLKLGEVKEKDADTITADIVTKDNSLVERFIIDRHTGYTRRDNS